MKTSQASVAAQRDGEVAAATHGTSEASAADTDRTEAASSGGLGFSSPAAPPVPEAWLPVPDWEGVYEVSDHGRVRRILRSKGTRARVMKGNLDSRGYPTVTLSRPDRKTRNVKIHVLVALSHLGPRPEGMEIRHLDGEPLNSHVSNLAYGTHAENMRDMIRHGRTNRDRNTHCPSGHPYDESNTWVDNRNARNCRKCMTARAVAWQQQKRDEANRRGENYFYNVRQWGRENGWPVKPTGGLAHALMRAYDEAHRARAA